MRGEMALWIALIVAVTLLSSALTIPMVRRYDRWRETSQSAVTQRIRVLSAGTLPLLLTLGVTAAVFAAAGAYFMLGWPSLRQTDALTEPAPAAHPMGNVTSMIAGLENRLRQQPDDPESWQMLGWSYMRTSRPADAARAYGRAVALDPRNTEYLSAQGEALVQAEGAVSVEAEALFRRARAIEPADPRARYFLAIRRDQQGDHAGAMADWIALIRSAPPDAPWLEQVRDYALQRAREQGIDLASKLPAVAPASIPAGPTRADIEAAAKMPEADRQAMIRSMVAGLAEKLKSNPRDSQGWIRLMRARMVLGENAAALGAYHEARKVFANMPADRSALDEAAQSLNLAGG